jgi:holo-[acyl-carrier protein] synthase
MIRGLGTDIVEMERIEQTGVERLVRRILTEAEQKALPVNEVRRLETIAGRFAVKEAIAKALGTGIGKMFAFTDVEILADQKGRPQAAFSQETYDRFFGETRIILHVSISHSQHYATAVAIIEELEDSL